MNAARRRLAGGLTRPRVVACAADEPLGALLALFTFYRVHHVLVVGADGEPRGIVSAFDVVAFVYRAWNENPAQV